MRQPRLDCPLPRQGGGRVSLLVSSLWLTLCCYRWTGKRGESEQFVAKLALRSLEVR